MQDFERQQEEIKEHGLAQPLVGDLELGFTALQSELAAGTQFQLKEVSKKFRGMRRVRGDGNCFFRAFMFSLVEQLQHNAEELARLRAFMKDSLEMFLSVGYELLSVETFQEMMVDFFDTELEQCNAMELFNGEESEYIVWFARLLCAAYLRANESRFLPFLPGEWQSMREFCQREVEPQGKECDSVQILALAEVLQVSVEIEYLSQDVAATTTKFGTEDAKVRIHLLYRPGHYDILVV